MTAACETGKKHGDNRIHPTQALASTAMPQPSGETGLLRPVGNMAENSSGNWVPGGKRRWESSRGMRGILSGACRRILKASKDSPLL